MFLKFLNNRFILVCVLPLFLGLLSVFSFNPFNFTIINFIIFTSLFYLLSHVNKKSKNIYRKKPYLKNLFFIGYFFGVGFFLSGTYWISYSLTYVDDLKYLIPLTIILLPLFLGLFYGFSTLICGPFLKNDFKSILLFSATFASSDFMRSKIFSGFPWNLWAYSWSWFTEIIQILNPIGLFAFNLVVITIFCVPVILIFKNYKQKYLIFLIAFLCFFANYINGSLILNKNEFLLENIKKEKKINLKIISPNFDLKYNLNSADIDIIFENLIKFSEPERKKETVFIWPEGVFAGYYFSDIKRFKKIFSQNFSSKHVIIFGINTREKNSSASFNSLIAVNNNLEIIYKYNKKKLVPFGEFLPFEKFFNNIGLKKVTYGYGSFSKGNIQNNLKIDNLNILPLICYEIIFPELSQKSSQKTNLIVNISEDAWFGGSIGPHQHFSKAIFRAVENNVFLARAANQGFSAFLSNKGRILKSLNPNETGNIEMDIPILAAKSKNKNDLIFFILLFTYIFIFYLFKKKQ